MSTTTTSPPSSSPPPPPSSSSPPSPAASYRRLTLSLLFVALALGTAYSVLFETYLDTSDPYLASLVRHPAHDRSYFARKRNVLNTLFVKRAWGWTVLVSSLLALAGRSSTGSQTRTTTRIWVWRITLATFVWAAFTTWFFGPPLFDRVSAYSGADCLVRVPLAKDSPILSAGLGDERRAVFVPVPIEYCHTRSTISADTHAHLFVTPPLSVQALGSGGGGGGLVENLENRWSEAIKSWKGGRARLYRGHDVSGHVFLLALCILFLTDQLLGVLYPSHPEQAREGKAKPNPAGGTAMRPVRGWEMWAFHATLALLALWWWMAIMTSVYFHVPSEKLSGFLIGVAGYLITLIPFPFTPRTPAKIGVPIPDEQLRSDAMHLD